MKTKTKKNIKKVKMKPTMMMKKNYLSDCLQDIVKQQGAPEREPAVFAVRWVQANEKKEPARSRRELRRQEATWLTFGKVGYLNPPRV